MGKVQEMILNGDCCDICLFIFPVGGDGHPRTCEECGNETIV